MTYCTAYVTSTSSNQSLHRPCPQRVRRRTTGGQAANLVLLPLSKLQAYSRCMDDVSAAGDAVLNKEMN